MAIIVDKDGNVVTVKNEPEEARAMFPNIKEGGISEEELEIILAQEMLRGVDFANTPEIPEEVTDLNTFVTPGIYRVSNPEAVANGPVNTAQYPYLLYIIGKKTVKNPLLNKLHM